MTSENIETISLKIRESAPLILEEIKKAKSILVHCHPAPDPDSVGSSLAMRFALEQLGKKVTHMKGDSIVPEAFMHFPGAKDIVPKNYFELDLSQYDLFIVLDSADLGRISMRGEVKFPPNMRVVNIDHHRTNPGFGHVNLVEPAYPATSQVLADLFKLWNIKMTREIAENLFIGLYTDTGGFKYRDSTAHTFEVAAELVRAAPDFSKVVFELENSNRPGYIKFEGLALSNVEVFHGMIAISTVSNKCLDAKEINLVEAHASDISSALKSVIGWDISAALIEVEPNKVKASFRTRNDERYDVSKLAAALGGGGHRSASGATLFMPLEEAKKTIVNKCEEIFKI